MATRVDDMYGSGLVWQKVATDWLSDDTISDWEWVFYGLLK